MADRTRLQELKQEVGLGLFEGRGWRRFHHHATLPGDATTSSGPFRYLELDEHRDHTAVRREAEEAVNQGLFYVRRAHQGARFEILVDGKPRRLPMATVCHRQKPLNPNAA